MAPSNTQGTLIPAVRRPATSVVNFQDHAGQKPAVAGRAHIDHSAASHVRSGPGLVDEDQVAVIERWLAADEHESGLDYVRAVLLGRV